MGQLATFHLPKWIEEKKQDALHVLGGSAAPSLSIDDLISLSTNPDTTDNALRIRSLSLSLGSAQGAPDLRSRIAHLYSEEKGITPEHVITEVGTTGANLTVFQSLLRPGDHVVCQYPTYPQLLGLPPGFQCEVSHWKLAPDKKWNLDLEELRKLIKPSTKMIILNNPSNPTGSHIDRTTQAKILDIAREHNVVVFADEIFRPLFHQDSNESIPPSLVEHEYSKVVVTSSMSKVWGMSGVRIGWIVCRDPALLDQFLNTRQYTSQSTGLIDEVIAAEALSNRCRPTILKRHLEYARRDLELLDAFVKKNNDLCSWTRPTAGATAFVKFFSPDGEAMDDVEFCRQLLKEQGVLLSPGSLCFGERKADFKGFVRIHFTLVPESLQKALELIDAFLDKVRKRS